MRRLLETVGNQETAEEFVIAAHDTAINLINRNDFPADVETLATTFGLIFNYWGRRSICKMYATDYVERVNNVTIERFIGKEPFKALDVFMTGWLAKGQTKLISEFYLKMIASKTHEYSL